MTLAVFPERAVALRAFAPELEVLRRQDAIPPAEWRATKQAPGEHPVAEDGSGLPNACLDPGVLLGVFGTEAGLAASKP
jgi:hypothetical protein